MNIEPNGPEYKRNLTLAELITWAKSLPSSCSVTYGSSTPDANPIPVAALSILLAKNSGSPIVDGVTRTLSADPDEVEELNKVNDAVVYGDLSPDLLDRQITIGHSRKGAKTAPGTWKNWSGSIRDWLSGMSTHEPGDKDGTCLLQGAVIDGERRANAVKHLDLLILDLDTGESIDAVRERIQELGLFAVIYTTHSHLKPVTDVKKDAVVKWMGGGAGEPETEHVCGYLQDVKRYQPQVLEGAELMGTEHTKDGVVLRLKHQPMAKFRVAFVLKNRFVIAERAATQKEAIAEWKERYAGVSKLIGAFYDRACVDPSRLFYRPRHPKDATEFRIEVIAGDPLNLDEVDRFDSSQDVAVNAFTEAGGELGGGRGEYKTEGLLRFFAKYGKNFEIDDFLMEMDPDGDRGSRSNGPGRTHRCPNDDQHTNAGDEEDKGFFCINASESNTEGAIAHCMHDACSELDRVGFVDLICQRAGIEHAKTLKKWVLQSEEEKEKSAESQPDYDDDEDSKPSAPEDTDKPFASTREAKDAIKALKKGDAKGAERIAKRLGITKFSATHMEDLTKKLAQASGYSLSTTKAEMKAAAKAAKEENDELSEAGSLDEDAIKVLRNWNKKYAVILTGNKFKVAKEGSDANTLPKFLDPDSFAQWTRPEKLPLITPDGETKLVQTSKVWLDWDQRRSYEDVVFEPENAPAHAYNIWKGWSVVPPREAAAGKWGLLRGHILDNVCQGDDLHFKWLMTWFAQMFRFPGRKLGSAVVVRGRKATGKSVLFDQIKAPMGPYATKISQRSQVTGNFNAHQFAKILIVCEEAVWAGDGEANGVLKDMITSSTMQMEKKGVDTIEVSNYARLAFLSNERWVVPASFDDERRFFILDCGDGRRGDIEFFAALVKEMESGGTEAMMAEFLYDWQPLNGSWDVLRKPPVTAALTEQAVQTLPPADRFFIKLIMEGGCRDADREERDIELGERGAALVLKDDLRWHFTKAMGGDSGARQYVNHPTFIMEKVRQWLGGDGKTHKTSSGGKRVAAYQVKGMEELRAELRAKGIETPEEVQA